MEQWWKTAVFYQIYIPSFCDGNNDGIGDFAGIKSRLGYLKKLGVSGIWLTPFYPSPKVDQGYDISDYYDIDPDYGTMEDFEEFIREAHSLGIKVVSDIVINHTSTEHQWFRESRRSVSDPKRNWYIWKKPVDGREPNNWESFFGEKAWEYDETTGEYYYHSFAKEQVDLNWAEPEVKKAVFQMLDFWAEKGIDGFRLDVINNLTLTDCMTDSLIQPLISIWAVWKNSIFRSFIMSWRGWRSCTGERIIRPYFSEVMTWRDFRQDFILTVNRPKFFLH